MGGPTARDTNEDNTVSMIHKSSIVDTITAKSGSKISALDACAVWFVGLDEAREGLG